MPQVKLLPVHRMTQKDKIVALMCRHPNKWFYPYEFMKPDLGALYVGYKAPTRIAELHNKYPTMFETRNKEQFKQRKLNLATINTWYEQLTPHLKQTVKQYLQVGDLPR